MTEAQAGVLQWLAFVGAGSVGFLIGFLFRGLFASGQSRRRLIEDAEAIARWQRESGEKDFPAQGEGEEALL